MQLSHLASPPLSAGKGVAPTFGRAMTAEELEAIRPLIDQVDVLQGKLLKPEFSSVLDSPAGKWGRVWSFIPLAAEAIGDKLRTNKAIGQYFSEGGKETVAFLQWVRFPVEQSVELELSNPCKGNSCPMTREGQPATGRAVLGKDMISWLIRDDALAE